VTSWRSCPTLGISLRSCSKCLKVCRILMMAYEASRRANSSATSKLRIDRQAHAQRRRRRRRRTLTPNAHPWPAIERQVSPPDPLEVHLVVDIGVPALRTERFGVATIQFLATVHDVYGVANGGPFLNKDRCFAVCSPAGRQDGCPRCGAPIQRHGRVEPKNCLQRISISSAEWMQQEGRGRLGNRPSFKTYDR